MIEINSMFYPHVREVDLEDGSFNEDISREERIAELKQMLADTDYKAIKYVEGWITPEEYEPIKIQRQSWRDEINRLEKESGDI